MSGGGDERDESEPITVDLTGGQSVDWLKMGRIENAVDQAAEEWSDPPERFAARRQAALTAVQVAYERGVLSKATALAELEPEVPVEGQSPETWWSATVRPALAELAEYNAAADRFETSRASDDRGE